MKSFLLCPSERPAVRLLAEATPLAAAPMLGQSLLEYWLSHLACSGVKRVFILAADRPEHILALVGHGERWGLHAEVIPESRELTPAQALMKYAPNFSPAPAQTDITVLDHLPGRPENSLFTSYTDWFAEACAWMPHARTPDRVGMRQLQPGIWVGLQTRISPKAQLRAPCWLGKNVFVGACATLGPGALAEDGAFIEAAAEVNRSYVGPDTFVGQFVRLTSSIAWGNTLIDCPTGSVTKVPDSFLLCALRQPRWPLTRTWLTRLSELYCRNKPDLQLLWKQLSIDRKG